MLLTLKLLSNKDLIPQQAVCKIGEQFHKIQIKMPAFTVRHQESRSQITHTKENLTHL